LYEVIVIDSGSFDGTGGWLTQNHPSVRFIQHDENVGFGTANNIAARFAQGRSLLFLNPDTELRSPAIVEMAAFVDAHPDAGAVGCRLLNADGTLQDCCIQSFPTIANQLLNCRWLRTLLPLSRLWGMRSLHVTDDRPQRVDVISGACLMVRRSAFESVQGFTQQYFMYSEDVDLCNKLSKGGYANHVLPALTVMHVGGGSGEAAPGEFSVLMQRESRFRYFKIFHGPSYARAYRVSTAGAAIVRVALICAALPLAVARGRCRAVMSSLAKWRAIVAWAVGARVVQDPRQRLRGR
jgi:GT2 family glycosyltransferase